ncbi:uncharacterized protein LOC131077274 [Cryptomeria japonica]|uniref:uncharacterized protein LOC131077274 n=1 Tax=Cryptomeria japonica TaxID=3369 RepID=UPI0027DA867B|nr:uncharacterized protein LOC131077274 [Cryptomeria japonica]
MEACGIATKFHLIALQSHPLNKSKFLVKSKTHLFCKPALIILSKFSASPAYQTRPRPYAYANACCCSNDTNSFAVQADTEAGHDRTVRVKLILQKECEFGEDFCVVGEEPILGSWDPQLAIPMIWSSGHIWTTPSLDIPLGRKIYFKFILRDKEGEFHWQLGPDRVFETWETRTTLLVSQDWYDSDLQTITEAETEEQTIQETLGEAEIEDQVVRATQEEFAQTRAGIVEIGEIDGGVPVLVPGLTSISYTAEEATRETLGETETEDRVVKATQEEFAETSDRIVERGEIDGGVPVLVPGLTSLSSYIDEDCSSTGAVPGLKNVLSADIDCLTKNVEFPGESPSAIPTAQEVENQQQQHQNSSSYVENGSVMRNNHASLSGDDEALTSGTTEISVNIEKEETSTSSAKELIESENTGASSESSCNEEENFSTIKHESDSPLLQKDLDWGRAVLSKLIWSLGLKNE